MRRLVAVLALLATPAAAGEVVVTVRGVSAEPGTIMVTLCAPDSFPNGACTFRMRAPARPGEVVVTLPEVASGRWALKVFHDRNGDFTLNTDWMGRPREPVAFGNDAAIGRFGPPEFEAAAITVPARGQVQTAVTLRYKE
jgi:uncharacterized protein (DUF2141 family)